LGVETDTKSPFSFPISADATGDLKDISPFSISASSFPTI